MPQTVNEILALGIDATPAEKGANAFAAAGEKISGSAAKAALAVDKLDSKVKVAGGTAQTAGEQAKKAEAGFDPLEVAIGHVGDRALETTEMLKRLVVGFVALYAVERAVDTIMEFDAALISASSTTKLTGAELREFGKDIEELSTRVPLSAEAMLAAAGAAGRLGVQGRDNLVAFTEAASKLAVVTKTEASEAATALGLLIRATGSTIDQADELAGVLAVLSKQTATSAGEFLDLTMKVAQSGSAFKLAAADAAAIASSMATVGLEARQANVSITEIFSTIDRSVRAYKANGRSTDVSGTATDAVRTGVEQMRMLVAVTGNSADELSDMFDKRPAEAFLALARGIHTAQGAGVDLNETFKAIGITNDQILRSLPAMGANAEDLAHKLETVGRVTDGTIKGLPDRFDKVSQSITLIKNSSAAVFTSIANDLLGTSGALTGTVAAAADFVGHVEAIKTAIYAATGAVTAFYIANALLRIDLIALAIRFLYAADAVKAFTVALASNPIGLVAAAIGLVVGALIVFNRTSDDAAETIAKMGDKSHETQTQLQQLKASIDAVTASQLRLTRARAADDYAAQVEELRVISNAIKKLRNDVSEGKPIKLTDIVSVGGNDVASQLTWDEKKRLEWAKLIAKPADSIVDLQEKALKLGEAGLKKYLEEQRRDVQEAQQALELFGGEALSQSRALDILDAALKNVNAAIDDTSKKVHGIKEAIDDVKSRSFDDYVAQVTTQLRAQRDQVGKTASEVAELEMREKLLAEARRLGVKATEAQMAAAIKSAGLLAFESQRVQEVHDSMGELFDITQQLRQAKMQLNAGADATNDTLLLERAFFATITANTDAAWDYFVSIEAMIKSNRELATQQAINNALMESAKQLLEEQYQILLRRQEAGRAAVANTQQTIQSLEDEQQVLALSVEYRQDELALIRAKRDLYSTSAPGADLQLESLRAVAAATRDLRTRTEMADRATASFNDGLTDTFTRAKTAGEAIRSLTSDIERMLVSQYVSRPFANGFGSIFNSVLGSLFPGSQGVTVNPGEYLTDLEVGPFANGAAFQRGSVVPFAAGDVFTTPSLFPMSNGRTGLRGEAGPEGLFPLTRNAQGKLAVQAVSGGGGGHHGTTINQTNVFQVKPDPRGAGESRAQIQRRLGRAARGG